MHLPTVDLALSTIEVSWYAHLLLLLPPGAKSDCVPPQYCEEEPLCCAQTMDHYESGLRVDLCRPLCEYHKKLADALARIPTGNGRWRNNLNINE